MQNGHTLVRDLAVVLGASAVTSVVFRRLRQPAVLGYLLAGLIVGPHVPIPISADAGSVHTLSDLGVILVMFSVGLEFSIRRLVRVIPTSGIVGLVQISAMLWFGYLTGQAFGWTARESVFTGAMIAISSTMILARVFAEQRVSEALTETVFGVLVVQDLAAVLILAVLTAVSSSGEGMPVAVLLRTGGQLAVFLLAIVVVGFFVVPRAIRAVARQGTPETLLLTSVGVCFVLALLAQAVGYSVALGAFLAGSLVAESGEGRRIEHLIQPVRDVFAAIFFVAVGMNLDPALLVQNAAAIVTLVLVVIVGQTVTVTFGAFLIGRDVRTSVQAGLSLAQIGEFSFIIAGLGVDRGVIGPFLYPVAIAVAVLTTFTTPWLVRSSGAVASWIDRKLPDPLQTFVALYGTWLEQLRGGGSGKPRARIARLVRLLALDAACLVGVAVAVEKSVLVDLLVAHLPIPERAAGWLIFAAAAGLAAPFAVGVVRLARTLGIKMAEVALPTTGAGTLDLAAAPRRALVVTLQLALVLLVGVPVVAVTQPFLPAGAGGAILAAVVATVGVSFWRSAANLHEHVQAGAEVVIELLERQTSDETASPPVEHAQSILPGLGPLTRVELKEGSYAVGKTLAALDLRALSGASVIAIMRGGEGLRPTGREELRPGDVLGVTGTHDAIRLATALLHDGAAAGSAH